MKTKKDRAKLAGIKKNYNLKIRQEILDQDYIDKLSDKEKDWLSRFNEEYVSANFNHEGKRIHPKKYKTKKVKTTGATRKIDVFKKDCEDKNNARNRDSYAITKSNNMLKGAKDAQTAVEGIRNYVTNETEDMLITIIDAKDEKEVG